MGALGIIGQSNLKNFVHIIFNNSSHESVGGQPNIYKHIDVKELAKSFGDKQIISTDDIEELSHLNTSNLNGPVFIDIKVQNYSDRNLLRPDKTLSLIHI